MFTPTTSDFSYITHPYSVCDSLIPVSCISDYFHDRMPDIPVDVIPDPSTPGDAQIDCDIDGRFTLYLTHSTYDISMICDLIETIRGMST